MSVLRSVTSRKDGRDIEKDRVVTAGVGSVSRCYEALWRGMKSVVSTRTTAFEIGGAKGPRKGHRLGGARLVGLRPQLALGQRVPIASAGVVATQQVGSLGWAERTVDDREPNSRMTPTGSRRLAGFVTQLRPVLKIAAEDLDNEMGQ